MHMDYINEVRECLALEDITSICPHHHIIYRVDMEDEYGKTEILSTKTEA